MHDNPGIFPTLPSREVEDSERWLMDEVDHGPWQTCWEYVLTHRLTDGEGAAFWTGANLIFNAMTAARIDQADEAAKEDVTP